MEQNEMVWQWVKYLVSCVVIIGVCGMSGCQQNHADYTKVELRGVMHGPRSPDTSLFLVTNEKVMIDDPEIARKLATFFPGLGTGRKSFWGFRILSAKTLEFVFHKKTGEVITIYTRSEFYNYWVSDVDQGDLRVKGDLVNYLRALFTTVKIERCGVKEKRPAQ